MVDTTGTIVCETKVASEPEALLAFLSDLGLRLTLVGLEAGPLSQWLHAALAQAGYETVRQARDALRTEFGGLHRALLAIVRRDEVCRRLMTAPGVGPMTSITYKSAVDDPQRFARSKALGAHFGLTPRKYQSGETDRAGAISRAGDTMVRTALYEAAHILLTRAVRFSSLKHWAMDVAKRRGMKRAKVALARKLAVILHRM